MPSEFDFLRNFFISNGFPSNLISSVIRNFINKRQDPQNFTVSHNDNPVRYYVFPYFGPQSDKLKNELLTLLNKYFTDFSFKIILVNNFKIGSFFNYKDRLPLCSRSSVVYKFNCSLCEAMYGGSTSRTLFIRTAEHRGISSRTGRRLAVPPIQLLDSIRKRCMMLLLDRKILLFLTLPITL